MRVKITRVLRTAAFLLVFAVLFQGASWVLRDKQSVFSSTPLHGESITRTDVFFMGSSHMVNGISPAIVWREEGISSVNMAYYGQVLPVTYYVVKDAFRYHKPKLLVLDVYKVVQDSLIDSAATLHYSLDNMTLGLPKLQAIFDLLPPGERGEYLFDIIRYHPRWQELTEKDFAPPDSTGKGSQLWRGTYVPYDGWEIIPQSETAPPAQVEIDYLEKIVELCRQEDVELLLVSLPFTTPQNDQLQRQAILNSMDAYAEEWGVAFVNMMYRVDEMGLDFQTDLADTYHLNPQGMEKASAWLGAYIVENYGLPDHRGDEGYGSWDDTLAAWKE